MKLSVTDKAYSSVLQDLEQRGVFPEEIQYTWGNCSITANAMLRQVFDYPEALRQVVGEHVTYISTTLGYQTVLNNMTGGGRQHEPDTG